MTQLAGIHTGRVRGGFAGGNRSVVTVDTGIGGLAMVKRQQCRAPRGGAVAQLAGLGGQWMRR